MAEIGVAHRFVMDRRQKHEVRQYQVLIGGEIIPT